jgi:muconolactone delta-isomerase
MTIRFMVTPQLHIAPERQVTAQTAIPHEREHVRDLRRQGIIEGFFLSADQTTVWLVMRGDSPAAIAQLLTGFPLYPDMAPDITPLV